MSPAVNRPLIHGSHPSVFVRPRFLFLFLSHPFSYLAHAFPAVLLSFPGCPALALLSGLGERDIEIAD